MRARLKFCEKFVSLVRTGPCLIYDIIKHDFKKDGQSFSRNSFNKKKRCAPRVNVSRLKSRCYVKRQKADLS